MALTPVNGVNNTAVLNQPASLPTAGGGKQQRSSEPRKGYETVERSESQPWAPAQPGLQNILDTATSNFNSGVGTAYPEFSTFAGMGQGTQDALSNLRALAANPSALTSQAEGTVSDMMGGDPRFSQIFDRAMAPSASEQYLSGIAAGPTQNPYLQQLLDSGSDRIANQVKASYSARGRYGSEDFTDALARGISEYQTPIQYAAYDADRARQMQAAGMIDDARLAGGGLGLNAAGADASQRLNAANLAGSFDQNRLNFSNALLNAGMIEDQYSQGQTDADVARFMWENGGAQNEALANYLATIGPIAGMGGTASAQQPRKPFQKALGAALGIAGTVAKFPLGGA